MFKKILLTAVVIFLMFLLVRWKQRKAQQMASNPKPEQKQNVTIYYMAGGLISLMACSIAFWIFYE